VVVPDVFVNGWAPAFSCGLALLRMKEIGVYEYVYEYDKKSA
jgi:hypothetical protein